MLSRVKMQVESVRDNSVAQAKLHAEAEKKEVCPLFVCEIPHHFFENAKMSYSSVTCFWHYRILKIFCIMKVFSAAIQHAKFEHRSPQNRERY